MALHHPTKIQGMWKGVGTVHGWWLQGVTEKQVKPAADKIAKEAEPLAAKANEQITKGAKIVSDKVTPPL